MAQKPPLSPSEVERILRELEPLSRERRIILIGGQAVAVWAAFFKLESGPSQANLFTSEDIDFEGAQRSARAAGELLGGEVRIPEMGHFTPNTGIVLFQDSEGIDREIDFIQEPHGLDARDVRDTAVQISFPRASGKRGAQLWVMHPERSMESRVHNVIGLKQSGPLALDQLRRSVVSARMFSSFILGDDSISTAARVRAVLRLNERIFKKCIHVKAFRDVLFEHGVDPFQAVLVDDRLPSQFSEKRHSQMVDRIEDQRGRARAQRERYAQRRRRSAKS
jgi:hypothetical protein